MRRLRMKATYKVISKFQCCGEILVTVIMNTGNVSIMSEDTLRQIVRDTEERKKCYEKN